MNPVLSVCWDVQMDKTPDRHLYITPFVQSDKTREKVAGR